MDTTDSENRILQLDYVSSHCAPDV